MSCPTKAYHLAQATSIADLMGRQRKQPARFATSLHKIRDTEAALCIFSRLLTGIANHGPLFDFPACAYNGLDTPSATRVARILTKDSLLLIDRRLALSDVVGTDWPDEKVMPRTHSALETALHDGHKLFFQWCNRKGVVLSDRVMEAVRCNCGQDQASQRHAGGVASTKMVATDCRAYRTVQYQLRGGAAWERRSAVCLSVQRDLSLRHSVKGDGVSTFGYATYLPKISDEFQAACLCIFGMNGACTLLCASLLASTFSSAVTSMIGSPRPRFVMLEFSPHFPDSIPSEHRDRMPLTLDDIPVANGRIVIDVTL